MSASVSKTPQYVWPTIVFISTATLVAFIGVPLYVMRYGIAPSEIFLFLFFTLATGMSITVGYHRLYAHSTFKTIPVVEFLILFFGAASFEQTALVWSTLHRDHHRYVDSDIDPYSIKKGFWHAHFGWIFFWKHESTFENAKDLMKNKMLMNQHKYYLLWGAFAGIIFPLLLGWATGHLLGAFIFAVCARLTVVYQSTFCINSVCHMIGTSTYDIYSTAKDHWFVALLTNGEGYHNFHHRFPTDYRNGVRWYHWDPSKWMIALLAKLGLASNLQVVSQFAIIEARLAAEKQRIQDKFLQVHDQTHHYAKMKEALHVQYDHLMKNLKEWEASAKVYRIQISKEAMHRMEEARTDFQRARQQWNAHSRVWMVQLRPQPISS